MKRLMMWRRFLWGLALLGASLASIAQDRLCDDRRSYQTWHDCLGSVMLSAGKRYEGPFRNGAPNGLGSALFTNGYRYIGQFKSGEYHGSGALVDRGLKVLQAAT